MDVFTKTSMKLLAGLGNPGEKYAVTRHNSGWLFLDFVTRQIMLDEPWQEKARFSGSVARWQQTLLLKPTQFMNRSGESVSKLAAFYKVPASNIIVAHDDLDLRLGSWKIQRETGPKVHNGLLSVEESLGTKDFWRVRLGVDNRDPSQRLAVPGEEYVLAKIPKAELHALQNTFPAVWGDLRKMLD